MKKIPKDTEYTRYKVCRWCKGKGEAPLYAFYWPCLECNERGYFIEKIKEPEPEDPKYIFNMPVLNGPYFKF